MTAYCAVYLLRVSCRFLTLPLVRNKIQGLNPTVTSDIEHLG